MVCRLTSRRCTTTHIHNTNCLPTIIEPLFPLFRSVFATIAQNRTTFLLFAVYKQVTQIQNLRNITFALILHDSQVPFLTTPCPERNYPSEKCFNIPRDVLRYRKAFQCSEWCFRVVNIPPREHHQSAIEHRHSAVSTA